MSELVMQIGVVLLCLEFTPYCDVTDVVDTQM